MKYRELRLANASWGTTYLSRSYKHAIQQFLTDPLYSFKPKTYTIEFRDGKRFIVTYNLQMSILPVGN